VQFMYCLSCFSFTVVDVEWISMLAFDVTVVKVTLNPHRTSVRKANRFWLVCRTDVGAKCRGQALACRPQTGDMPPDIPFGGPEFTWGRLPRR
jgi:hypothetical protein